MNHLLRQLAPLTGNEWKAIDEEAKQTLKMNLSARRLVDFSGPHGWQASSINLGRADPTQAGKDRQLHQHGHGHKDADDSLDVVARPLESNNNERREEVDRQHQRQEDRAHHPRVPRSVTIPRPLPDAVHAARLSVCAPTELTNEAPGQLMQAMFAFRK